MSNYKVVNSPGKEIQTDIVLHPGGILSDELEARSVKKTQFAAQLCMKLSHFSEMLHGKRHVGAAIALKLEKLLDIPTEFWMQVQVYHDLYVERHKQCEAA
jgi:addiction module HigA family antidote